MNSMASNFTAAGSELGFLEDDRPVTADRNTFTSFSHQPLFAAAAGYGDPVGTDTAANIMVVDGVGFEYTNIGTQTILAPAWSSAGLSLARDLTANEGTELTQGITAASRGAYTVGTDAFYAKAKIKITDVSGTDDCAFGLRKAEAYQAAIDNYDEMAAFNVISGNIYLETILNGAATVATDTTENWADLATKTLEVRVTLAGDVTFLVDGVDVTSVQATPFVFDAGEVVIPFMYFLHDTDLAETTYLLEWEVGLLKL